MRTEEMTSDKLHHDSPVTNSPRTAFQRECLFEIHSGKFLSSHRGLESDYDNKYICMRFVKRSEHVVEMFESIISDIQDPRLCADGNLRVSEWPIVDADSHFRSVQPCQLPVGGYNVRIYDRYYRRGICDAYEGETRVENQCTADDGFIFRFRHSSCIPPEFDMSSVQRTFCIANWIDGENAFSIIRCVPIDHRFHATVYILHSSAAVV